MRPAILGTKVGMTRILVESGKAMPVTVVKAGPCTVLQVRDGKRDGYDAVQLGYLDVKPHRSTMPMIGHAAKAGTGPKAFVREARLVESSEVSVGDVLTVEQFAQGRVKFVDVSGISKGKGFSGPMKRYGFGGLSSSHGVERKHRSAGGIGGHADSGHGRGIKKGKHMAGHQGSVKRTSCSLRLLKVDLENGLLVIHGSIPGANGSLLFVRQSKKKG